jgi:hypothetical protein
MFYMRAYREGVQRGHMASSNVLYVVSKEEMENPSGPLAFPTKFAEAVTAVYEGARKREERQKTVESLIAESLRNEARERSMAVLNAA